MLIVPTFQTKILTKRSGPDDYETYRAGLEWDLTEPIVIESGDDFRSRPRWHDRVTPYLHQVTNLITFCRRLPVTLLADDVGLGKTISAGLIVSELLARGRLNRVLVVCPKILGEQWKDELATKFDIPAEIATGRALLSAAPDPPGVVITTYETARRHLDSLPEDRFEMLILDEAHKLRNLFGTDSAPQVAVRFRQALEQRRFRFVLMLTATPIQNRLWDLYSLVELLTVARGHENPFGTEGMFARRFIADSREQARQLRADAKDEFRSIVYRYMSRMRRDDAKLYFPTRIVHMERVDPSDGETDLIKAIAAPIQKMDRLTQVGILKDIVSSPEAVASRLNNMARNGTAPAELAAAVRQIVARIPASAKLQGLSSLIERLRQENPGRWRVVVFTTRRETQTSIQDHLERQGLKVGIINGDSAARNQSTIASFRANPPGFRVVVSTEAGSEGVNLQVANVLVNYDLPWNPMIVEQRIGRIQRLASDHAHVSIFNITLRGTFEEYIVGRLMEKLQMAASAIGDIEALLQGSNIAEGSGDEGETFEKRILGLVLTSLAGKDVERATQLTEQSIAEAKAELEREEANINAMLGSASGTEYQGPRAPTLPPPFRSMGVKDFALRAMPLVGIRVSDKGSGIYRGEGSSSAELFTFERQPGNSDRVTVYSEATPAFQRLVRQVIASGVHNVNDLDEEPLRECQEIARQWSRDVDAKILSISAKTVRRMLHGEALLRVRAVVAHDSYERVLDSPCLPEDHFIDGPPSLLDPIHRTVEDPGHLGVNGERLTRAAMEDEGIAEFCRFYLERRDHEVTAAGADERKRRKLADEFTPRVEATLVGLEGRIWREVVLKVRYQLAGSADYQTELTVRPQGAALLDAPKMDFCGVTGRMVPADALARCDVTGTTALQHLLNRSDISGRMALREFVAECTLTGRNMLHDEGELSSVTGKLVARDALAISSVSGRRAEPAQFRECAFTKANALSEELWTSEISGLPYRHDQTAQSSISGRKGHRSEFIDCYETRLPIALDEGERCELTDRVVRHGILQQCAESGKRVLPSELRRCSETGTHAIAGLFVNSSVSGKPLLDRISVRSASGAPCAPSETQLCLWSSRSTHPEDLRTCSLTGCTIHVDHTCPDPPRLRPLQEMLDGFRRTADEEPLWTEIARRLALALNTKSCRIEAGVLSPDRKHLAFCGETRTLLGWRVRHTGAVFDLGDRSVVGHIAVGKRTSGRWEAAR